MPEKSACVVCGARLFEGNFEIRGNYCARCANRKPGTVPHRDAGPPERIDHEALDAVLRKFG